MPLNRKASNIIWKYIAYLLIATNGLGVIILLEMIIFGKPLISLFIIIFSLTLFLHLN